ncbi:MAG: ATP-binding protein [Candidatus Falkowbacteria bacterium]
MKFKRKIFFTYLLLALVPLILLMALAYFSGQQLLANKDRSFLDTILSNEVNNIQLNLNIFHGEIGIKDNDYIKSNLAIISDTGNKPGSPEYDKSLLYLDSQFKSLAGQYHGTNNIFFVNSDGVIVYDLNKQLLHRAISDNFYSFGSTAFRNGQAGVYYGDIYPGDKGGEFLVSAPVYESSGDFLGVIMIEVSASSIYNSNNNDYLTYATLEVDLVKLVDSTAKTTDSRYIYNKNGDAAMFLNPLRFDPKAAFNRLILGNSGTDPVQLAARGNSGYGQAADYRGKEVLSSWRYLPENNWGVVVKIDKSEITANAQAVLWETIFEIFLSVIVIIFLARLLADLIYRPIPKFNSALEKISAGNFDISFDDKTIKAQDELNSLSKSFLTTAQKLKDWSGVMDKKVSDKAAESAEKSVELDKQKRALISLLGDMDIERRKAEVMANDLEKFRLAVEGSSDHIVITDPDGIVIYANKMAEQMTGYKVEEAVGKKAAVLWKLPMPLEFYQNFWKVIKTDKKVLSGELQNRRKNGEIYTVAFTVSPVFNKKNEIVYFVGVERDITKAKQLENSKDEFVSLISHQLRTPLSAISLFTEMLISKQVGELNPEQIEYLDDIRSSNKRMIILVNSILNVSRLDMGTFVNKPKDVDLAALARNVIEEQKMIMQDKKIKFKENIADNIPMIKADPDQVRMVFQNLLSNATNYTPAGKKVDLSISLNEAEKNIVIVVKDEGIGIPSTDHDMVFNKLFRSNNAKLFFTDGNGLGLYIVKAIVERLGGKIWFESTESIGTTFFINLPLSSGKTVIALKKDQK